MRNFILPALNPSSQNPGMTLKSNPWELEKKIEQQAVAVKELRYLVRSFIYRCKLVNSSKFFIPQNQNKSLPQK